jgi:hypothetical protein
MNIFYLHPNPKTCAEYHVDKHCVKMILETAQLLSTAHRILDGVETTGLSQSGRNKKVWQLPDSRDTTLYSATHINHPSAIWARHSARNYLWLFDMFVALQNEYTYRYGKVHKCAMLLNPLSGLPHNISLKADWTEPTPAMPDQYKVPGDSVKSYHNYYNGEKQRMFSWKQRSVPPFINKNTVIQKDNYATV